MHDEPLTTGTVLTAIQEGGLDGNGDNLGGRKGQPPEQRGGKMVPLCCEGGGSVAGRAIGPIALTAIRINPAKESGHCGVACERRTPALHSSCGAEGRSCKMLVHAFHMRIVMIVPHVWRMVSLQTLG